MIAVADCFKLGGELGFTEYTDGMKEDNIVVGRKYGGASDVVGGVFGHG